MPHEVAHVRTTPSGMNSLWKVVVGEGKTHEVREMFHRVGHPVQRLVRVAIGPLSDPKLRPGAWRELSEEEIELLRHGGSGVAGGRDMRGPKVPEYMHKVAIYVPGKPVEEVERELGVTGIVKLASNENPLGSSPKALAAVEKALPT